MKYFLIGEKLCHSYSMDIHKSLGLNYSLRELSRENFADFIKGKKYSGLNITIPYKKDIIPYLDYISEEAQKIGAVNTVFNNNDVLYGYNTDFFGIEYAFNLKSVKVENKNVLILGTGGTSNTAEYFCKKNKAKMVYKVGRNCEINYQNCYEKCKDINIIINCTPVGMYPNVNENIIDLSMFNNLEFVFDCIYNPLRTNLIIKANELKIKCQNGISMLVAQAIKSQEIWLNKNNDKAIKENINKLLKEKLNIVLYGMPSCGKSTIGKILAKRLKRELIDTDKLIEEKFKKTPSEIILEKGEEYFRNIESEIIKEISLLNGKIISIGGGAVVRNENMLNLKRNCILFYIKRDISLLTDKNRPLSRNIGIEKIYLARKEIYESNYDYVISNNFDINSCVNGVIEKYESFSN